VRRRIEVEVRYPVAEGELTLCVDDDQEVELEPSWASRDRGTHRFVITTERPFVYARPHLRLDGEAHPAKGAAFLAIADSARRQRAFPYFFTEPAGSITDPVEVPSNAEGTSHRIAVYLPPSYPENTLKRYPVLYMHDGQNLFFPEEAFAGTTWQVKDTVEMLDRVNAIEEVIVVGVWPAERIREYTRPGYVAYGTFLAMQLKPMVDERYRTMPKPADTGVMGSSLGGVVSLYLAWEFPEVFGKAACMSSTFDWEDNLRERIEREPKRDVRLYLDSGGVGDNFEVTRAFAELLQRRGYTFGRDLLYLVFPAMEHTERDWGLRSLIPFQYLFGTSVPRKT
jgi:predicted alpha/beta superfamily hydrolase